MNKDVSTQWEENAEFFASLIDGKGTPHHRKILNPAVEKILGDVTGLSFLDAGCGEGYLSKFYAQKGALVTGIDISDSLLEVAKEKIERTKLKIDFHMDDVCTLRTLKNDSFDVVLSNLVLLNISCFNEALNSFHRVLKTDGVLVFSIVHPAFNFYGPGKWEMGEKDPKTRRRKGLFFKVDHYPEEKEYLHYWYTKDGTRFPEPITFYHRTLATYINSVVKAGFVITQIDEPIPVEKEEFFNREERIPFFLIVKARKA